MHLNSETALDLIDGRLELPQQRFWSEHITLCNDCREELGKWQGLRKSLKGTHLQSAPVEDINRAVSLFAVTEPGRLSKVRQVFAEIVFDSFAQSALAGARGAADARQVVLRAEDFDIHVKIWGVQERRYMMGQILPRSSRAFAKSARLHLVRNGTKIETKAVDEMGEFRFDDVPNGLLSLQIDLPHVIVIGPLNDPGSKQ